MPSLSINPIPIYSLDFSSYLTSFVIWLPIMYFLEFRKALSHLMFNLFMAKSSYILSHTSLGSLMLIKQFMSGKVSWWSLHHVFAAILLLLAIYNACFPMNQILLRDLFLMCLTYFTLDLRKFKVIGTRWYRVFRFSLKPYSYYFTDFLLFLQICIKEYKSLFPYIKLLFSNLACFTTQQMNFFKNDTQTFKHSYHKKTKGL
jgi:hypothetical protein